MNKILILLLTIFTVVPVTNAQEANNFFISSAENLMCAEVLPGNSVVAPFFDVDSIGLESLDRDSSANLPIQVINSNGFPLQNVNVHLRLFKVADSEGFAIAPQLHSTQAVNTDMTLAGGETVELNHSFTVPTSLTNGTYEVSTYVESNQRFPLSGTQAYESDPANSLEFTLTEGQPYGSMIDRTTVQINSTEYTFTAERVSATSSSAIVNGIDMTEISVVIKNASGTSPTIGTFSWEVFTGDQPNPVALVATQTVSIKLIPGTQTEVPYQLLNPQPVDYTVVGTLSTENSADQTVVITLGEDETDISRPLSADLIDFATFAKSSVNENSTDLIFCYTPANLLQYQNPGLNFSVSDASGVMGEYSVDFNDISYSPVSQADRFSFPSAPGAYTVEVSLLESGAIVSTSTLQYFNEAPETQVATTQENSNGVILAAVTGLLGLLIFGLLFYRRSLTKLEN